jgi:hypothetical protein
MRAKTGTTDGHKCTQIKQDVGFQDLSAVGCKALSCYLALNDTVISKIRVRIAKFPEYRTALVSATVTGKIDVRARRAASAGFDNRSQIDEHRIRRATDQAHLWNHNSVARRTLCGTTRKEALLESVRLGVTTWTFPLLAPAGTVVVISELETTVKTAAVPLKLTQVAPVRLVPRIVTGDPTLPEVVCVFTNGPRPTDRRKTVPQPGSPKPFPPASVVP